MISQEVLLVIALSIPVIFINRLEADGLKAFLSPGEPT